MRDKITRFEVKDILCRVNSICYISGMIPDVLHLDVLLSLASY
jgi:hypothetical protein